MKCPNPQRLWGEWALLACFFSEGGGIRFPWTLFPLSSDLELFCPIALFHAPRRAQPPEPWPRGAVMCMDSWVSHRSLLTHLYRWVHSVVFLRCAGGNVFCSMWSQGGGAGLLETEQIHPTRPVYHAGSPFRFFCIVAGLRGGTPCCRGMQPFTIFIVFVIVGNCHVLIK